MSADRFSTRKLTAFSGANANFLYFEICCADIWKYNHRKYFSTFLWGFFIILYMNSMKKMLSWWNQSNLIVALLGALLMRHLTNAHLNLWCFRSGGADWKNVTALFSFREASVSHYLIICVACSVAWFSKLTRLINKDREEQCLFVGKLR